MSDVDTAADTVAPSDQGATVPGAATVPTDSAPVQITDGEDTPPADGEDEADKAKASASVQKSINRLTRQRADAERRAMRAEARLEAQQSVRAQPQPQASPQGAGLKQSDFATYEDYIEARTRAAVREEMQEREKAYAQTRATEAQHQQAQVFLKEASQQAAAVGIDFEDAWETLLAQPNISDAVADSVIHAKNKAVLADHLAKNPAEVARLSDLPPYEAARELARLDVRLGAKAPPRTSNAPPPPVTVGGRSTAQADPRKMSMNDFAKWLDAQE